MQEIFERAFTRIKRIREAWEPRLALREVGTLASIASGIAKVRGLPGVGFEEVLRFPDDSYGIAFNIEESEIGVVLLDDYSHLHTGDEVERTGNVLDVAVGGELIGRVIDPLGRPLDGNATLTSTRVCQSSAQPRQLSIVRPSRCRCRQE